MSYAEFDNFAGALSSLATIVALVVGGWWAYGRFVRTRDAWPKLKFSVDIEFVCKQDGF